MRSNLKMDNTNQTCYRCRIARPLSSFTRRVDDRYYNMCKACVSEILCSGGNRGKQKLQHTPTHRTCYLCRRLLENAEFTKRSNGSFFSACKDCNRHVFGHRRRARMKSSGGSYTTAEWESLLAQYARCPMCLRSWAEIPPHPINSSVITVDHIIPISKGGTNSIDNIQPLCYSCNSKKGAKV